MPTSKLKLLSRSLALFPLTLSAASFGDVCEIALSNNAIDRTDTKKVSAIAFEQKESLCDKEYESAEEFRSKARSSGFSASYAGFGLGYSGGKATSSGQLSFSSEEFCTASESDFQSYMSLDQTESMAGAALKAWTSCINATQINDVYLEFTPNRGFDGMSGWIIRRISGRGPTDLFITDMKVTPQSAKVSCSIEGRIIETGSLISGSSPDGLKLDTAREAITCDKSPGDAIKIAFGTTVSDVGFADLPSRQDIENAEIKALEDRLERLRVQVAANEKSIRYIESTGLSVSIGGNAKGTAKAEFRVNNVFHNTLLKENPESSIIVLPVNGTYTATAMVNVCTTGALEYVSASLTLDKVGLAGTSNRAQECGSAVATATFAGGEGQQLKGSCGINQSGIKGSCYLSVALR
ncbi:MAG: hypothetical protein AAGJ55_02395 [Cyanobacteria bacterium J06555_12]